MAEGKKAGKPSVSTGSKRAKRGAGTPPAWARLHLWQMQPVRDVLLGLGVLAIFWLGQATSIVTVPLLLAILLAYLFEPVIQFAMTRLKISRQGAVVAIIASLATIVVVPATIGVTYGTVQAVSFSSEVYNSTTRLREARRETGEAERVYQDAAGPVLSVVDAAGDSMTDQQRADANAELDRLAASRDSAISIAREELDRDTDQGWVVWVFDQIRKEDSNTGEALEAVTEFISNNSEDIAITGAGVAVGTIERILGFALTAFGLAFMGFVTAFFFFFLATGWVEFRGFTDKLIPDKHRDRIIDLAVKFDAVISGFIRGRITIAFIQSIVFSIGYFLVGVPAAFILGPVVAILSIVPYLALVGVPVAIGLIYLDEPSGFRGAWWWMLFAPTLLYFVGQALDDYVWTPLIQGKSTGLDTPVILFASIAGGALFGVFGLLIAIPLAACAKILIQEIFWPKFKDWAEGRSADPLPLEEA